MYRRIVPAHANCIENLPVFAVIVFAAQRRACTRVRLSGRSNAVIGVRFGFFSVQLVAFIWMIVLLMLHVVAS